MSDQSMSPRELLQWAMKPPQAYVLYLLCVVLVGGLSFYVGTMKPRAHAGLAPPPPANVNAPRSQ
ncbi:hypothetical protein [Rhodopseudomonas sp. B29]|uniref:hypothetical protein n=1 Tax=Rhodopseudomonas sp. B29 TaxID=95607 RepID=UPI0003B7A4C4|nr:hypothetical protein [Rhodopseudomonas sp. B29]